MSSLGSIFGGGPKTPAPPDPAQQAARQQADIARSEQQQATLNRVNQTNAYGGQSTWTQTGVDANGTPIYSQQTSWGAPTQAFNAGLTGLGGTYIQRAQNMLDNPTDLSSMPAFQQASDYATATLGRQAQIARDALDTKLKNQGLQ